MLFGSHKRWAMTERGRSAVSRSADELAIGPSRMHWDGRVLTIDVDEVTAPIPSRIRGRVRLFSEAVSNQPIVLDETDNHCWWPIAPRARVEVELDEPKLRW
ncbi:MAG: carotenoid 1,2-hydratase, partial [Caulobacteraceae bacterium]|nr:carotenoid 1,2-hydratase [Caulobacter sp.]